MDFYVTIVFNQYDDYCRLLVISPDNDYYYWSDCYHYKTCLPYKKYKNIMIKNNKCHIFHKNGKNCLILHQ